MARLVCPLCGTVVVDGAEPAPGSCAGCGTLFAGGGESPPAAVAAALAHWGIDGVPAGDLARRLFEVDPPPLPEPGVAITSDQRDDFYLWWVFVHTGDAGVGDVLRGLLTR
jgi:hypothetical protein